MALVLVLVVGSGCGYVGVQAWPRRTVTEVVEQRGALEVRAVPRGARVVIAGEPTYEVRTTYRRYSRAGLIAGALVGVAAGIVAIALSHPGAADSSGGMAVGMVLTTAGIVDLATSGLIVDALNRRARRGRTVEVTPSSVDVEVTWEDFDPVRVSAAVPHERVIVVTRPATLSFDQGLIHWARTAGRPIAGEALLAVGRAYARRARTGGAAADRDAAIDYLQRYVADPAAAEAAEAAALLQELRP